MKRIGFGTAILPACTLFQLALGGPAHFSWCLPAWDRPLP